jgi:DNA-binding MarR family transcriptional regulator
LAHALRERIEPLGVVPGQFAQLLALYEQDGLTQAELCARVQIEQFTMANPLSRMERDGLVDRVPDPADRRRSPVRLTPRARELEGELAVAARAVNAAATHGLDEREIAKFMATLADHRQPRHHGGPPRPSASPGVLTVTSTTRLSVRVTGRRPGDPRQQPAQAAVEVLAQLLGRHRGA